MRHSLMECEAAGDRVGLIAQLTDGGGDAGLSRRGNSALRGLPVDDQRDRRFRESDSLGDVF